MSVAVEPVNGALIAAEALSVRLGGRRVVDNVSFAVGRGETVSLLGPKGAGKTTLLRALLGLLPAERGSVRRAPGLVVGYMPQRLAIEQILPLSVGRFLRLGRRAPRAKIAATLAEVGMVAALDQPLHTLSGGELQRVLLARALLRDPDLLILDEPAQQVDFQGQIEMFHLIGRLRGERGCGVLIVSHDLHLVMGATDRVLCLNGHICCSGRPETVSRHPEYLALFGPRAAEDLAVYQHSHGHAHGLAGEVLPLPTEGKSAVRDNSAAKGAD